MDEFFFERLFQSLICRISGSEGQKYLTTTERSHWGTASKSKSRDSITNNP